MIEAQNELRKEAQTEYRGAIILPGIYGGFEWEHPDHVDADWTGDGWSTFGCGHEISIEECKEAINEMFLEIEEAEKQD